MSDFLTEICALTRQRVEVQKRSVPPDRLKDHLKKADSPRSLEQALHRPGTVRVIAELKQASPSAGVIRQEQDIPRRILAYERGGAAALSILTEEHFFHGSPHLLEEARSLSRLPILRKDFIIDPYQILESKMLGADAILLITGLLPGAQLRDFILQAAAIGLESLVEVHDEAQLAQALQSGARVIGINNRDLRTLRVDCGNAARLLAKAPRKGITLIIESGIKSSVELPKLKSLGAHGVLIGETFMRAENPEALVKEFTHACRK
jgi:indole-3-glycerol phosphate synthase